jgi:hypothetical protein
VHPRGRDAGNSTFRQVCDLGNKHRWHRLSASIDSSAIVNVML